MIIKILCIGDIVGRPGRRIVGDLVPRLRDEWNLEAVIANGENMKNGSGLDPRDYDSLREAGVDVVTSGDHIYRRNQIFDTLDRDDHIIRPGNYPDEAAGKGHTVVETRSGLKLGVINVQGTVFMNNTAGCPYKTATALAQKLSKETNLIIVDMHAEATSEKVGMGWHLDGRVSCVFGTHTHIPTNDYRILPKGTAHISDIGMTGPYASILGRRVDRVLHKFITNMPAPFDVADGDIRLCGITVDIDTDTGLATDIQPVMLNEEGENWRP
jgi:metallophosphoesterase (TIGR00282 family)